MKIRVLRDKKGKVVASINPTPEDANRPPLHVEVEDGGQVEEVEVRPSDLRDTDKLFEQIQKK
jgi:hypothetical protein